MLKSIFVAVNCFLTREKLARGILATSRGSCDVSSVTRGGGEVEGCFAPGFEGLRLRKAKGGFHPEAWFLEVGDRETEAGDEAGEVIVGKSEHEKTEKVPRPKTTAMHHRNRPTLSGA
ncbi:hypothetical protein HYQ46_006795 [Verticillium longisporum]|nr:hypothetical protein HYQ46_006795 [Verticillium longisporum]